MTNELFTIGYSPYSVSDFIGVLRKHRINAVADVRSSPYSNTSPDFSLAPLKQHLRGARIRYVFLGDELGARRIEPECYCDGKARYEKIRQLPLFREGIDRLNRGMREFRIALLCAEKDPITCHRTILVCREFRGQQVLIRHVLADGSAEEQSDTEERLLKLTGLSEEQLFDGKEVLIDTAYDIQADRIAYSGPIPALKPIRRAM